MQYKEFKKAKSHFGCAPSPMTSGTEEFSMTHGRSPNLLLSSTRRCFSFSGRHELSACLFAFQRSQGGLQIRTVRRFPLEAATANYSLWRMHLALDFQLLKGESFGHDKTPTGSQTHRHSYPDNELGHLGPSITREGAGASHVRRASSVLVSLLRELRRSHVRDAHLTRDGNGS